MQFLKVELKFLLTVGSPHISIKVLFWLEEFMLVVFDLMYLLQKEMQKLNKVTNLNLQDIQNIVLL